MYVDIHTHRFEPKNTTTVWALVNVMVNALPANEMVLMTTAPPAAFSIGIHPWFIPAYTEEPNDLLQNQLQTIDYFAALPSIKAIGEFGYDKGTTHLPDYQENVLKKQFDLALLHQKPAILHWVGGWDRLLRLAKSPMPTALVHGFSKGSDLALQLVSAGFYLSFGGRLLYPERYPASAAAFAAMPPHRLFLETDDDPTLDIATLYAAAARLRGCSTDTLVRQIMDNHQAFFANRCPF